MLIGDLFSREIDRDIKEVIKVDDRSSIMQEIEEYVPTRHIEEELVEALERYQETINNPSDDINMWVSGFFGSGKSSFAKVFGYLVSDPHIDGKSVADRFFEINEIRKARQLLHTIHSQAPSEAILLDLNTSPNVLEEGEPVVLPIYRTLLHEFGYSRDLTLARLEFELEKSGQLETFESSYEAIYGVTWESQRNVITARNRASRIMHELDPATYPTADTFAMTEQNHVITAKDLIRDALSMLERRRPGKSRLALIVDEVGQYVSRSVDRMRHLQGLAEECQKTQGKVWLIATSQEKLTDVIDSLEGVQTELARGKDRFEVKVDLLPSDIDEVTGKRILDKTAVGASEIKGLLDDHRNKLNTAVSLQSDRHQPFSDEDFVRLYPLVPYQLEVLIDAVSARRNQGGMPQTMGGSNRTLIRHAQQLLSNGTVGLAPNPVGDLVTLDRSFLLLEDVIPTAWRREVDQVVAAHGEDSLEARIMRVIALCTDVPGFPLTAKNLAVALHPSISSDPIEPDVRAALGTLVNEDRIHETDDGYRLQSPEQKDWEKTRRGIDMKPGDAVRLRKSILRDALGSLTVSKGRSFKVELHVEREKMSDGDIALDIRHDVDVDSVRQTSRDEGGAHRTFWSYDTRDDTWEALKELHRSSEMIDRYDNASQTDAQRVLLGEERRRRDRAHKTAAQLVGRDLTAGVVVFAGVADQLEGGDPRPVAQRVLTDNIEDIYPSLDVFSGTFRKNEILQILQADDLNGLPEQAGSDGLGLFRVTVSGRELVTDSGPIEIVSSWIRGRSSFQEDQNGRQLEDHFGGPPYGATVEVLQAALAGAIRAGLLEVVSQAARITSHTDHRLEQVFGALPKFRAASFKPATDDGVTLEVRGVVSEWLQTTTGEPLGLDLHDLAESGRKVFAPLMQPCVSARSMLTGAGLAVPAVVALMDELLGRVTSPDDTVVVETIHQRTTDLEQGRVAIGKLGELLEVEIESLRQAKAAVDVARSAGDTEAAIELESLLDRARYGEDLAPIKARTTSIENAIAQRRIEAQEAVVVAASEAINDLRTRYANVADDDFDNAATPLSKAAAETNLEVLSARLAAIPTLKARAAELLDALTATRQMKYVRVGEVWPSPISTEEELDAALARVREAVLSQLDDDSEVRLR